MNSIISEDIKTICDESLPWENMKNKKILVTGAYGFLASYIVYTLLEKSRELNITVYAICRDRQKAQRKFCHYMQWDNFYIINQDVCDDIDDKYRSDIIIHAASPSSPYIIQNAPYDVIKANVIAYDQLLKKCSLWGSTDLLLFSSSAVYGYNTPLHGVDETYRDVINFSDPTDVYYMSKQMCEMMTECKKGILNCNVNIVRPFVVYGPGDFYSHRKCMTDFLGDVVKGENIVMKSKGEAIRSYIYISDAITACFYVLLRGENTVYNICAEDSVCSIKELAEMFCDITAGIHVIHENLEKSYIQNHSSVVVGKNDKLHNLGWKEKISLEVGLARTISWAEDSDFLNS